MPQILVQWAGSRPSYLLPAGPRGGPQRARGASAAAAIVAGARWHRPGRRPAWWLIATAQGLFVATTPGRRSAASRLLIASLAVTMAADTLFSVLALSGAATAVTDGMYLVAYLLLGAAGLHPSMAGLSEPARRRLARLGRAGCSPWGRPPWSPRRC